MSTEKGSERFYRSTPRRRCDENSFKKTIFEGVNNQDLVQQIEGRRIARKNSLFWIEVVFCFLLILI